MRNIPLFWRIFPFYLLVGMIFLQPSLHINVAANHPTIASRPAVLSKPIACKGLVDEHCLLSNLTLAGAR
jgi:hypothetical protein